MMDGKKGKWLKNVVCQMSKNEVSKQNCNINLNYIKYIRDRFTAICEKCYAHILANYRTHKE